MKASTTYSGLQHRDARGSPTNSVVMTSSIVEKEKKLLEKLTHIQVISTIVKMNLIGCLDKRNTKTARQRRQSGGASHSKRIKGEKG